ncbi:MAG: hypothetical protein AAF208_03890 [Cyanobacteria bacterium P01_A01_bin.45]
MKSKPFQISQVRKWFDIADLIMLIMVGYGKLIICNLSENISLPNPPYI